MANQVTPQDLQDFTDKIAETYNKQGLTDNRLAELDKELCEISLYDNNKNLSYKAGQIKNVAIQRVRHFKGHEPVETHRITGEMITSRSPEEIRDLQEIATRVVQEIRQRRKK